MASRLRTPTIALAGISMCLCLGIIGTAGRSIHVFNHQQSTNVWLLPIWPNHFDIRELQALIGTAGAICVLNAVLAVALVVPSLPANGLVLISSLLSTLVGIVSIAFPTVINHHAPVKDTLKTWTCRWAAYPEVLVGFGPPDQFNGLCHKTRFAYFTTIPVFILQLALLSLGIYALFSHHLPQRGRSQDMEKGVSSEDGHQLRSVSSNPRNVSFETKSESPVSYQDSTRILGGGKQ